MYSAQINLGVHTRNCLTALRCLCDSPHIVGLPLLNSRLAISKTPAERKPFCVAAQAYADIVHPYRYCLYCLRLHKWCCIQKKAARKMPEHGVLFWQGFDLLVCFAPNTGCFNKVLLVFVLKLTSGAVDCQHNGFFWNTYGHAMSTLRQMVY